MLASRVLITAGTPGHRYLVERQWKCLKGCPKIYKIDFLILYTILMEEEIICSLQSFGAKHINLHAPQTDLG